MRKIFIILLSVNIIAASAQVGVHTDFPDNSSAMDIVASNKGLLIPRVTLTSSLSNPSPVTSPAVGLMVFNSGSNQPIGFYYWNGTNWVSVVPPQGTTAGDMLYWDGAQWVLVPAGDPMQILKLCNGVPTWGPCTPAITTTEAFGITQSAATSGGNITDDGGAEDVRRLYEISGQRHE